ncbi:glycosyltransferase family 39 protein [Polynucleobacter sp. 15G-AUS-farblos]|uniref:glycosyltransferase family 39 protein n=1 Tax=Polynucleobacter sp. 15G-AUS-farblos TaxID=2689094 RepID=UPI001C0E2952|nr:glycosyltransferase family 39 protein [Polynucleobacter sp. 15G-AUS-farblos]MBU3583730.1 glycosyltransferase family 39 protein [Polynucleobacter sp. 15G-AUS-farblos]
MDIHSFFDSHNRKARAWCVSLFFLCWFALGISIYKQYGISWDESIERTTGIVSVNYIGDKLHLSPIINNETLSRFKHHQLETYPDRVFGPLFGIISVVLERALHIGGGWNEKEIFQFRHLLTFLIVLGGGFAIFRLSERRFSDWRIGLLTLSFFVLSPRFFAESFYNNKDLVFLSVFAIATNCMIQFILKPQFGAMIFAAFTAAIVIDIRITGIVLPAVTLTILILRATKKEILWSAIGKMGALYLIAIAIAIVAMWPWLWSSPLPRFLEALKAFSRWTRSDSLLFFMGQFIRSTQLPWEYAPVWIAITTPLLYLFTFLIGALATIFQFLKKPFSLWASEEQLQDLIFVGLCASPVLAVIFLHSVIYDGWRHLYFIYPSILLLATKGCIIIWRKFRAYPPLRISSTVILIVSVLLTANWMVHAHPLQNVYFNALVGKNWKSKFDVDYWGLANRQALEYILEADPRNTITVFAGSDSDLNISAIILDPNDRVRILVVNQLKQADYIITNYRANPTNYALKDPQYKLIYEIKIGDEIIESVFKNNHREMGAPVLKLNEIIDFKDPYNCRLFLMGMQKPMPDVSSWSSQESWGVWAEGRRASIRFPISTSLQTAKSLNLTLNALVTPGWPTQRVNIYVNGKLNQTAILTSNLNNVIHIPLTSSDLKAEAITVNFLLPDRVTPSKLGIANDDRELSVGITSAVFH